MSDELLYTPDGDALGWLGDEEDRAFLAETSYEFFGAPEGFTAPRTIDNDWIQCEDQKSVGSCAGHAISSCLEICNYYDTAGGIVQISRMYCYLMGQRESGISGDRGATISGVVASAMKHGAPLESTFPYPGRYVTTIPEAAHNEARGHKLLKHTKLRSYQEVFDYLATGTGAVIIGIPWVESLVNSKGRIEAATGRSYGGHALAITGYTSDALDNKGRPYPIMQNSHGTAWGKGGRAIVAPHLFDAWGRDQYSEMIGVSDLQEYGTARKTSGWASRIKPF